VLHRGLKGDAMAGLRARSAELGLRLSVDDISSVTT